jgi:DeoR family fructose operon transcriptional repressor
LTQASEPANDGRQRDAGSLFQAERRAQILKRVHDRGRVDVGNLADEFGVTGETIRRDLSEMQRARLVRRVHGGAVPWRGSMLVPKLAVREGHMVEEKRRIARAALAEVPERGTLIIDSGSTALHLADLLDRDRDLVVVTNSIPIMRSLANTERPKIIGLGGKLERRTMAFVDEAGVEMLSEIHVDVLFFGCDGMSPENGYTTPFRSEVAIKRAMMASARRVVMMFDHSKVANDQLFRFAEIDEVDIVYSDSGMDDVTAARIEEYGPRVVRA